MRRSWPPLPSLTVNSLRSKSRACTLNRKASIKGLVLGGGANPQVHRQMGAFTSSLPISRGWRNL